MFELVSVLVPIALVDSMSITPLSLVPLASMLAGRRAYLTAGSFLLGLFVSYMMMALAFLFGLGRVLDRLNEWFGYRWNNPDPWDFGFEILLGIILLVFGIRICEKRQEKTRGREMKEGISPGSAFGFAFMLNVVGFPGAVPYFAAADHINRAELATLDQVLAVTFYVLVFLAPLASLILLRAALGPRMDRVMAGIQVFFDTGGKRIVVVLMILLGLFLVVDGVAYFVLGNPVVPVGWPGSQAG